MLVWAVWRGGQILAYLVAIARAMLAQALAIFEDMHLEICQRIGEQNREWLRIRGNSTMEFPLTMGARS
jgi:hypothetical protein